MDAQEALAFVRAHGIVLMSARGALPTLTHAIAGGPIRGSWWAHRRSHHIYRVLETVCDSEQVLVCRLAQRKVTLVHRRLWPALARLAGRLPKDGLVALREEHTARGHHRVVRTPFPGWVPKEIMARAGRLSEAAAVRRLGAKLQEITGQMGDGSGSPEKPAQGAARRRSLQRRQSHRR
jgi:hypothetical protein